MRLVCTAVSSVNSYREVLNLSSYKHLMCRCISASSVGQGVVNKCGGEVIVAVLSGLADDGAYDKIAEHLWAEICQRFS